MKIIDREVNIYLQGDLIEVGSLLSKRDIPITKIISNKSASFAVVSDESCQPEELSNAEIICLINFSTEKADVMAKFFNHSVFNFTDYMSCADFITGYYYSFAHRVFGLDIWDIHSIIGHKTGSGNRIMSLSNSSWSEIVIFKGILITAFSDESIFNEAFNDFKLIHQNTDMHISKMFLGENGCNHEFLRHFILK